MVHRVYLGAPIVFLKITMTNENTKELQFGGGPV